jgi:hypothetical protein
MSFLNIAIPVQGALPAAELAFSTLVASARPLLGMGILATMAVVFKPLLLGVLRAATLVVHPRLSKEERIAKQNARNLAAINRAARDLDNSSPAMAAELRALVARS